MNQEFAAGRAYLANQDQLCYTRLSRLEEGSGRGQRIVDVCNGSGLQFTVTPDRGMNLVECSFRGIPMAFRTPLGHRGITGNWLGDWTAGMMTTSGLRNVGNPSGKQGLHGQISAEAAEHVSATCKEGEITVSGVLHEGGIFDDSLRLERVISTGCGRNAIEIADTVTNCGENPAFTEILYHCNFGYPFASPELEFDVTEHEVVPRNEEAAAGLADWMHFPEPLDNFSEHCFRHRGTPGADGMARFRVLNRKLGIAVTMEFDTRTLPYIMEWKKPSRYAYVLGLEPSNASLNGCEFDRENGFGKLLAPGECIAYKCALVFEAI